MDGEEYQRAAAVRNVKGSRLPTGRALEGGEIRALFAACADGTPAGARDAAAFALMFGMGMRRAEVAARLADYEADSGTKPPASCTCPTSGTRLDVPARAVWVCASLLREQVYPFEHLGDRHDRKGDGDHQETKQPRARSPSPAQISDDLHHQHHNPKHQQHRRPKCPEHPRCEDEGDDP